MAMKLPCVTSGLANKALLATEDNEILVGYSPEDYAEKITILLKDSSTYNKIAEGGYKFIIDNFNWESQVEKINRLIVEKKSM